MDWTNLFNWNATTALVYSFIGVAVWISCSGSDLRDKIKHPKLVGLAASLWSCFELGLYAIVPAFVFLIFSYALEFWFFKLVKGKE